ncbi:MAG TPA: DUF4189 domain-containing protein, partial [Hydrogenophaga sp.]
TATVFKGMCHALMCDNLRITFWFHRFDIRRIPVLTTWKLAIALAISSTLVACGGGSSATPRGAIAINPSSGFGAISTFYTSQPEANSDAVNDCGGAANCVVVLEFAGAGECGSIAWSNDSVWGVGSAGSKEQADKIAVAQCAAKGGSSCLIPTWLRDQCT